MGTLSQEAFAPERRLFLPRFTGPTLNHRTNLQRTLNFTFLSISSSLSVKNPVTHLSFEPSLSASSIVTTMANSRGSHGERGSLRIAERDSVTGVKRNYTSTSLSEGEDQEAITVAANKVTMPPRRTAPMRRKSISKTFAPSRKPEAGIGPAKEGPAGASEAVTSRQATRATDHSRTSAEDLIESVQDTDSEIGGKRKRAPASDDVKSATPQKRSKAMLYFTETDQDATGGKRSPAQTGSTPSSPLSSLACTPSASPLRQILAEGDEDRTTSSRTQESTAEVDSLLQQDTEREDGPSTEERIWDNIQVSPKRFREQKMSTSQQNAQLPSPSDGPETPTSISSSYARRSDRAAAPRVLFDGLRNGLDSSSRDNMPAADEEESIKWSETSPTPRPRKASRGQKQQFVTKMGKKRDRDLKGRTSRTKTREDRATSDVPVKRRGPARKILLQQTEPYDDSSSQTSSLVVKLPIPSRLLEQMSTSSATLAIGSGATTGSRAGRKRPIQETPKSNKVPYQPPTPTSVKEFDSTSPPKFTVDPDKLALSQVLTARAPLESKPAPQGSPPVWAESRQALCETLPYFKKPQGGCYQNDGHVYGFLFDSVGHCREYLDEDIIICRAGGSMESNATGGMVQKKDQSMKEAQPQSVLNDIAHKNPLVVTCGNRNVGAKCKMPHQYCVLGWYKPVDVWTERTAGKSKKIWKTIKYRLERLNSKGEPAWHAPRDSTLSQDVVSAAPLFQQECSQCSKRYPQVYLQGWMCLNGNCEDFWMIGGQAAPVDDGALHYNPDFLLHRAAPWGDEKPPTDLRPPLPDTGKIIGDNLAYINTRGICCPECGRCNPRRFFDRWVCENPGCDFQLVPSHQPVMPAHLHTPWDMAPTLVRNRHAETGVHVDATFIHGYKITRYSFDGIHGCFIHAAASKAVVQEESGADDMLRDIQSEDLRLERRTFAVQKMSGGKGEKKQAEVQGIDTTSTAGIATAAATLDPQLVKFRMRKDMEWTDYGIGFCAVTVNDVQDSMPERRAPHVTVTAKDDSGHTLLKTRIAKDVKYQHQLGGVIVWREGSGADMSLSFEDAEACASFWDVLTEIQQLSPASPIEVSASEKTRATNSGALESMPPNSPEVSTSEKQQFAEGSLMTAFSMNYGMPYKFVASGASKPFKASGEKYKDAPKPVLACRSRLNWAQRAFLDEPENYMDFNEELVFGYLEGQKIEYHDDGEDGLGPRIATLSLGGRAKMHMRMKIKHYVGCSKTGILTEERPVPGGFGGEEMYRARLEKWEELQSLKAHGDVATYTRRRKTIPKELGIFDNRMKKADDLVTVTLNHGDIVLMDGYDIQKYLEHKVVPEGRLRFALTCRTVLENHLKPEELPDYHVEPEAETERYHGPVLE